MRSAAFLVLLLVTLAGNAFAGVAPDGARDRGGPGPDGAAESAQGVYFERDSAVLDDTDVALIARLSESLRDDPTLAVTVRGYVDDTSSAAYGLAIGQRRIEAVRKALLAIGVPPRRIRTEIRAGDLADGTICSDDDCRTQWRRVDMVLGY